MDRERKRDKAKKLADEARQLFSDWDSAFGSDEGGTFFESEDQLPPIDLTRSDFCPINTWWFAEFCRLAYTPDVKEELRPWHREKRKRSEILNSLSGVSERASIHKTGNHASLYRIEPEGGEAFTLLCFRGTNKIRQWLMNLNAVPRPWEFSDRMSGVSGAFVHSGFDVLFKRAWPLIESKLRGMPRPFVFVGHSLGGAFATMAAMEVKPDLLLTFGSPKVGNEMLGSLIEEVAHFRVVNGLDLVPMVPSEDTFPGSTEYVHCGKGLLLNESGGISEIEGVDTMEAAEPLERIRLALKDPSPPAIIVDHLMSSYCERLQKAAIDGLK